MAAGRWRVGDVGDDGPMDFKGMFGWKFDDIPKRDRTWQGSGDSDLSLMRDGS
jgi:hypothetical protein